MNSLQQRINQIPTWALIVGAGVIIIIVQRITRSRSGGSDHGAASSHVHHDHHGDSGNDT